jgi:AcrR family transcriptional regulator
MDRKPTDKRVEKGEQTRARILNAAVAIIAEQGIKEVSAAKLAAATGVSKSNIFHHFKSVDDILTGVLRYLFEDLLAPAEQDYPDLESFLRTLGESVFRVPEQQLNLFKAFFSFYHEGMFKTEYRQTLNDYMKQMTETLSRHIGLLSPRAVPQETKDAIAALLLSMLDGLGLHALLHGDGERYEHAWHLQVRMIGRLLADGEQSPG